MRQVLDVLERKTAEFAAEPLFAFMSDSAVDPVQRFAFVPALAHFVMTFADLYALVFREEPARDTYQELVNAHTYEDGGHWKWFLSDLDKLGYDPPVRFSDALRFVWSDATVQNRMLSYGICKLAIGADSLRKLVLVECIESAGKVSLKHAAIVGKEIAARTGKSLTYFGSHHFETEADHTLEKDDVRRQLDAVHLDEPTTAELIDLVDRTFVLFTAFARELLAFAKSGRRLARA